MCLHPSYKMWAKLMKVDEGIWSYSAEYSVVWLEEIALHFKSTEYSGEKK